MSRGKAPLPVVVLVSGHGSNLQAILDRVAAGTLPVDVRAVVSDKPDAQALKRARAAGVTAETVTATEFPAKAAYDNALNAAVDRHSPALVILAGFMRILGPEFVRRYRRARGRAAIILMSADPTVEDIAAELHVIALQKSGDPSRLLECLGRVLPDPPAPMPAIREGAPRR